MRTPGPIAAITALLFGVAVGTFASPSPAQQAIDGGYAPKPPAPAPATASAADPPVEPVYDPAAHGGLPYGTYLRATRGRGLQSPGMMIMGIILVGVGNIVMGVGSAVYASAGSCGDAITPDGSPSNTCPTGPGHTSGMAILIAGTLGTALGVPLWVLGATPVPRVEAASVPELRVGPRGAMLTWSF
jgi:hypothetical protein